MKRSQVYRTAFIAIDNSGLDKFIRASFCELEHHAKSFVNKAGTYHITVNIDAFDMKEANAETVQLNEVA